MINNKIIKFFLFGSRSEVHDRFIDNDHDFKKTISEIEESIRLGNRDNIIININIYISDCVKESNYFRLNSILKLAKNFGIKKIYMI